MAITFDRDGSLWLAAYRTGTPDNKAVLHFKPDGGTEEHHLPDTYVPIRRILVDDDGTKWFVPGKEYGSLDLASSSRPENLYAYRPAYRLVLDGRPLAADPPPFLLEGRVLVPLRLVGENLGLEVNWDGGREMVTLNRPGLPEVKLVVGEKAAAIGGRAVSLEVAPVIRQGRVYVPLRFVTEAMGAEVNWSEAERTVFIVR